MKFLNRNLAAELRAETARQKLKYAELASKTQISNASIVRKLAGERELTITDLGKISSALHFEPSVLLRRAEQSSKEGKNNE